MRLSPSKFNSFLGHIGQQLRWRKAYDCPCINPHSGAAKHNCAYCSGKGKTWADPVDGVAGVAGHKVQREWAQFGLWESGDLVVTIPGNSPLAVMGEADRVTMLNGTDQFSLSLTRGQHDRLTFPVENVARVFWYDEAGTVVEGGIPTVAADGTLTWVAGEPPAGTVYSISGAKQSDYFCWGPYPSTRNMHSGADLPQRVVLRRWDLFGR